ncbi:MAG TPA: MFS transporter, partial [Verrucomicrobiae bacterium]|nr:MFS transporter [Verrucomicrobiae bacterium]
FLTTSLGATPAVVGIIEGLAESLASLLKVFSGYVGDKTKKKKELAIIGYGSSVFGKFILVLAGSWSGVLISRIIDRFGKGIRTAPRDALIAESAKSDNRGHVFGLHRAMDTLGAVIGISIGYLLLMENSSDLRRIFWLSAVPAVLGVVALFFVRQPREITAKKAALSFSWTTLDIRLRGFLILAFVFTLGNSSNQFLLLKASSLGASTPLVLLLYLAYNLAYAVLSYPAGRISDRIGRKRVMIAGYLIYAFVYFGFARVDNISSLWALFVFYGFYVAFTEGVEKALLADIAPQNLKGTVIGLHATLVGVALLPASLLAGVLWDSFGAATPFYFGGGMGLLAAVGLVFVLKDASLNS